MKNPTLRQLTVFETDGSYRLAAAKTMRYNVAPGGGAPQAGAMRLSIGFEKIS